MTDTKYVRIIDVVALLETPKALLCDFGEDEGELWIPKSQIAPTSEVRKPGQHGVLVITEWIARRKQILSLTDEYEDGDYEDEDDDADDDAVVAAPARDTAHYESIFRPTPTPPAGRMTVTVEGPGADDPVLVLRALEQAVLTLREQQRPKDAPRLRLVWSKDEKRT